MSEPTHDSVEAVLSFWFGAPGSAEYERYRPVWFRPDAAFDNEIRENFGALVEAALRGAFTRFGEGARSATAHVIVLDQFPRNMYRGRAEAFSGDAQALATARAALDAKLERELPPVHRMFLYMPFMHSESLVDQERSVHLHQDLAQVAPELDELRPAIEHRDVIRRFGRFPRRNGALSRTSTPEELAYLTSGGRW